MLKNWIKHSGWIALLFLLINIPDNNIRAQDSTPALTEHGHPNLQGFWTNPFQTPLERPIALGDKTVYSDSEARELRARAISIDEKRKAPLSPNRSAPEFGGQLNNQADGNFEIMPIEYISKNKLDFLEGNIIKYISRHKKKNGAEDIRKVIHYAELILELEYGEK